MIVPFRFSSHVDEMRRAIHVVMFLSSICGVTSVFFFRNYYTWFWCGFSVGFLHSSLPAILK